MFSFKFIKIMPNHKHTFHCIKRHEIFSLKRSNLSTIFFFIYKFILLSNKIYEGVTHTFKWLGKKSQIFNIFFFFIFSCTIKFKIRKKFCIFLFAELKMNEFFCFYWKRWVIIEQTLSVVYIYTLYNHIDDIRSVYINKIQRIKCVKVIVSVW